jgi:hypothetical protein
VGPDTIYIHHFISSNRGTSVESPISGCLGAFSTGEFIDAGQDSGETDTIFSSQDGEYNSGYHMDKPNLHVSYDLVSMVKKPIDLAISIEIEWVEGKVGKTAGHALKSVRFPCCKISRFRD